MSEGMNKNPRETPMNRRLIAAALLLASSCAAAHEGHGLAGAHWHASDLFGLALALAAGAGMVWWRGRK
jgi:hypothetical protein